MKCHRNYPVDRFWHFTMNAVMPPNALNYLSMYLTHRVRTVTATQTVPQRGEVCSLKKIWKNPRIVKETTPGLYLGIIFEASYFCYKLKLLEHTP